MTVIVVGGGAAGFFAAIHHQTAHPEDNVIIIENTNPNNRPASASMPHDRPHAHVFLDKPRWVGFSPTQNTFEDTQ
jgi:thioredoxin reductase